MIGIRPDFAGDEVPQGGTAKFSVIAVDPDGKREALKGAQWSLVKVETQLSVVSHQQLLELRAGHLHQGGRQRHRSTSPPMATPPFRVPVDWGHYRLEVETADPEGPATSYEFDAGWYVASTTTETPDGLEIALDKDNYAAGEVAKLKISPHFAGELLVTIGADKLLKTVTATVPAGGSTVDIPVGDDWGAGAYVTATLFRPGDAQEIAHADPRHRRQMAEGRSGLEEARRHLDAAGQDLAAPAAVDPGCRGRRCSRAATPMSWLPPSMSASST